MYPTDTARLTVHVKIEWFHFNSPSDLQLSYIYTPSVQCKTVRNQCSQTYFIDQVNLFLNSCFKLELVISCNIVLSVEGLQDSFVNSTSHGVMFYQTFKKQLTFSGGNKTIGWKILCLKYHCSSLAMSWPWPGTHGLFQFYIHEYKPYDWIVLSINHLVKVTVWLEQSSQPFCKNQIWLYIQLCWQVLIFLWNKLSQWPLC